MHMNTLIQFFTLDHFNTAYLQLKQYLSETPVLFDEDLGLSLKLENHHPTRSFKVRGAFNKILSMSQLSLSEGLVTGSAGNHGQALALAARQFNVPVTVFVPEATPRVKVSKMQELGAEVVRYPGLFGEAESAAIQSARDTGRTFVSAYNDPAVIVGAGTLLLEWLDQQPDLERILVPAGGGGLISGIGLAAKMIKPEMEVIGVLSEASPFLYHQYYFGNTSSVKELPTLTDGLAGAIEPDSITLDLVSQVCDGILQLTEAEIAQGIIHLYLNHHEIIEGSGAVGVAAVIADKIKVGHVVTGAIITGGNIDPEKHLDILRVAGHV